MPARDRVLAAILVALPGFSATGLVQAQGLGELSLNSALNEPLNATIPLFQLDGLDASQIRVGLASESDFARADIPRPDFLRNIEFRLEVNGADGVLHITSPAPVVEPYLNFLVDARWPSGRMLREYTVLLDLPTFSQAPAARVEPAVRASASQPQQDAPQPVRRAALPEQNPRQPQPAALEESAAAEPMAQRDDAEQGQPAVPQPQPESAAAREDSVEVQTNDTLWQIALRTRPDDSVSVQQMMLAIQRGNEAAFLDGNINGLMAGQVLRIPSIDEVLAVNREQAFEQVAQQNFLFNPALDAQPLVGGGSTGGPSSLNGSDELTVLTGGEETRPGAGEALDATLAELENSLMLSEENLDRASIENQELSSRLADLDAQIETLQNIIAIEDQRLAQLQAELAARAEEEAAAMAAAPALAPIAQPDAAPQSPATPNVTAGLPTLLNDMLRNPMVMGGGLAALVLVVLGFLVWRRRKDEEERDEDAFQPAARVKLAGAAVAAAAPSVHSRKVQEEPVLTTPDWLDESDDAGEELEELEESADRTGSLDENAGLGEGQEESLDLDESAELDESLDLDESAEPEESLNLDDDDQLMAMDDTGETSAEDDDGVNNGTLEDLGSLMKLSGKAHLEAAAKEQFISEGFDDETAKDADEALDFDLDLDDEPVFSDEEFPAASMAAPEEDSLDEPGESFEFRLDDEVPEVTEAAGAAGEMESLDFNLHSAPAPAAKARNEEEVESFEFRLDESSRAVAAPAGAGQDDEEEHIDFSFADSASSEEEQDQGDTLALGETSPAGSTASGEDALLSLEAFEDGPELDLDIEFDEVPGAAETAAPGVQPEAQQAAASDDDDGFLDFGNLALEEALMRVEEEGEEDDEDGSGQPLTDRDEVATKLDLAVAYEAMGDLEGALQILDEVVAEGTEAQAREAKSLAAQWSDAEAR